MIRIPVIFFEGTVNSGQQSIRPVSLRQPTRVSGLLSQALSSLIRQENQYHELYCRTSEGGFQELVEQAPHGGYSLDHASTWERRLSQTQIVIVFCIQLLPGNPRPLSLQAVVMEKVHLSGKTNRHFLGQRLQFRGSSVCLACVDPKCNSQHHIN